VYTTLDLEDQQDAMDAVTSTLDREDDPEAALVSIDDVGAVRAMVGGRDWGVSQVNLAVGSGGGGAGRQPGSSFKPFVLAEALAQGTPLSKTYNAPSKIKIPKANNGEDWEPGNYADASQGTLDLVTATAKSSNTAFAQLMMDTGPEKVVERAHRMGLTSDLPAFPALVLGTAEVSPLEMAAGYSTLANGGERVPPYVVTKVTDPAGNVLYEHRGTRERALDQRVAAEVNYALTQVVQGGTGTAAKIPGQSVAGKTGTTDRYRDAWFVGFTCKLTTAVWMGYPGANLDGTPRLMENVHGIKVTGGSLPTTIWQRYMAKATQGLESCDYPRPAGAPSVTTTTTTPPESTSTTAPTSSTSTPSTAVPATPTTTAPPVNQPAAVADDQ
jgi:penicillin-binding protein 1A